ncbi:MAG: hypothetical protein N2117_09045 [Anaerolineales bacterium]|nr:hypothetical protein [Anaerolineales bacterium]MCX7755377.1 hypothetical protein [Anaerolineales bacterium]MDW8278565.1 tetratricopeptide repeat protein [Anaerolineales bacterium]
MTDYDNQLLRRAIIHAKAGEYDAARRYLTRALELADDRDTRVWANYWMSKVVEDPAQKRAFLEETLAYEPTHPEARRELAILDGVLKPQEIVNADALPAQSLQPQTAQADRFTCPKCGGRMVYAPDGRSLYCEFCTRNQTLSQRAVEQERDFILTMATVQGHYASVAVKTLFCEGCGAQFVLPPQEMTGECAYCGSNHVVRGDGQLLQPDSILPMRLNQRQAVQVLVSWVESQGLRPARKVQPPRGMYLPLWTFDIAGVIPWSGYIVRTQRNAGLAEQREFVQGEKDIFFDDILVPGAPKLAGLVLKLADSFETNQAVPYDARYLAGWPAELPQMSLAQASLEARQQAAHRARSLIQRDFPDQAISNLSYSTARLSIATFKLLLVPLWLTILPIEESEYRLLIDGVKGNVYCEMPPRGLRGVFRQMFGF